MNEQSNHVQLMQMQTETNEELSVKTLFLVISPMQSYTMLRVFQLDSF